MLRWAVTYWWPAREPCGRNWRHEPKEADAKRCATEPAPPISRTKPWQEGARNFGEKEIRELQR